jgi:hypothetical protein
MFQRIQQYALQRVGGRWYRPRAYGDPQPDGRWEGWLIFFPLDGGEPIAPPHPETTQTTLGDLAGWAAAVTPAYLDGALHRALTLAHEPATLAIELADAEYDALLDAERLETSAEIERATADLDEVAAQMARDEADRIRRERLATESAVAGTEEVAANVNAAMHERAAQAARETADKAARRRRSLEVTTAASREYRRSPARKKKR